MNITVIGGGSWGLGLAKVLSDNNHQVMVFDVNEAIVQAINEDHRCIQLDQNIPESIQASDSCEKAVNFSEVLLFVVPTKVLRSALTEVIKHTTTPKLWLNAAKGIEPESFKRMSEIFDELVPPKYLAGFASISGPSHAEEVIKGMPTAVTCASIDEKHALRCQEIFHNQAYFRVYTSTDLIGTELGGSLKNIFALASGILRGQGLGDNAMAAVMTRGLVEMERFYNHFGAQSESLKGLTGIGDLIVTCTSNHSRNFQAGYQIGSGEDYNQVLDSMSMVVEGIRTCEAAYHLAKKISIDTPIIDAIYDVIFNRVSPKKVTSRLLLRTSKAE